MKKPALIATITAGVVVLGGGAWAATTLPASDEGEVAAVEETPTPTPTIEPSVTPTPEVAPTPTPTPEVVETPEPEPEPQDPYITAATDALAGWGKTLPEDEIWAAGYHVCDEIAAGVTMGDFNPLPQFGVAINGDIARAAQDHLC